ncbi:hypothetical protein OF83DRAFT_764465 [Amylostereum chailletii]|nr:hypothetical protein OF83DRAFT_764465 [Amylostereum chailletii]
MNGLTATPPRRPHELPTSGHTPSPALRPSPSSSAASVAQVYHPITIDAVLAANAGAPSPELAALEHVVNERNTLSSQNSQLWKLIEKSRGAYIESQKNLDRVRSERDAYKSKLLAAGENTDAIVRSYRERERSLKPSSSTTPMRQGDRTASSSSAHSRSHMVRHQSDESGSNPPSQSLTPEWGPSRERPPPTVKISHSRTSSNPPTAQPDPVPSAPQVIKGPPRSGSLPPHAPPPPFANPLQIPKFVSNPNPTSLSAASASPLGSSPMSAVSNSSNASNFAHEDVFSPSLSPSDSTASHYRINGSAANTVLTPQTARPAVLSRESRISLPDEARQYISSMAESPLPSPRLPDPHSNTSSPALTHSTSGSPADMERSRSDSEFLDMDDDDKESTHETAGDRSAMSASPAEYDGKSSIDSTNYAGAATVKQHRAAADDFPLPPSGDIPVQRHEARHTLPHQASVISDASSSTPSVDRLRREEPLDTPTTPTANAYNPHLSTISAFSSVIPESTGTVFRALPLLQHDLPRTAINVTQSAIRPNDRGRDVLSFIVLVDPGNGKESWSVEKLYSDVIGLDQRVRARYGRSVSKKVPHLPDGKLWKDHAPSRVDQRKAVLEQYLQALIKLPIKNNDEIIAFLTSDIAKQSHKPVSRDGYKEGYLTKRGKNFGGWKTRFFVLQGPVLEYYENRGGAHLGSIPITGAQIGRQQKPVDRRETDEEGEYRHAFLIIEPKKVATGSHRHVLCAESDTERDDWVDMLVRYVSGTYTEDASSNFYQQNNLSANTTNSTATVGSIVNNQPRASSSSSPSQDSTPTSRDPRKQPVRGMSKDDISVSAAVPLSQLAPDSTNAKLFRSTASFDEMLANNGTSRNSENHSPLLERPSQGFTDAQTARRILEKAHPSSAPTADSPLSSSLPSSSPLDSADGDILATVSPRANSELGHYPDLVDPRGGKGRAPQPSPERGSGRSQKQARRTSYHPTLNPVQSSPPHPSTSDLHHPAQDPNLSTPRPDMNGKVKISGPMNGTPIPAGYKFGGKEPAQEQQQQQQQEKDSSRRDKAKSRIFWGWRQGDKPASVPHIPRNVFGVTLDEALDVAQIANLPAVVFRCIQYLEDKKADQEEGIYRLSGSSAVIKGLKDRFNNEGDVDLLASDEFWDPHAIAGLLKGFFRDLPASILTRDLHMRFLAVMDFVNAQERIEELSRLISMLPIANYSLLRALTAHLILIVQNANVNKMTMRNVGIVFSPTLGIPAGVFSLMLAEFNKVFNVDEDLPQELVGDDQGNAQMRQLREVEQEDPVRRNSRQYNDAAADQLLGLSGRKLMTPDDDGSDGEDLSVHDESGTETTGTDLDATVESGSAGSPHPPDSTDLPASTSSRARSLAATRGLNITTASTAESKRASRMMGLPASPRPPNSPMTRQAPGREPSTPIGAQMLQVPR